MWISWKHQDSEFTGHPSFDRRVELFYEQALGWQLHIANLIANGGTAFGENGNREGHAVAAIRHSGFAVLQICLSYFETIGHYTSTQTRSKAAFSKGVRDVFPDLALWDTDVVDAFLKDLYHHVRCGLYHNVRTVRVGLGIPPDPIAIAYDRRTRQVIICPERLPGVLIQHLDAYRAALMDPRNADLRSAFEARFIRDYGAG